MDIEKLAAAIKGHIGNWLSLVRYFALVQIERLAPKPMISGMGLAQRIRGFRQSRIVISLTRCFTDGLANSYQTADRWSKQIVVSQSASGATPVTAGSDSLAIDLGSIGWREKDLGTRNSIPRPLHCLLLWEDTGRYGATPCNIPPPLEQTWGEKEQNHTQGCKRERKRKNKT